MDQGSTYQSYFAIDFDTTTTNFQEDKKNSTCQNINIDLLENQVPSTNTMIVLLVAKFVGDSFPPKHI